MLRNAWLFVPVLLVSSVPCFAQQGPTEARRQTPTPATVQEHPPSPQMTAEMWIYEQERARRDDPATLVRRKAELKGLQRAERMASLKWYGMSNSRPLVTNVMPMLGGMTAPTWTSNSYDPNRWRPYTPSSMGRY